MIVNRNHDQTFTFIFEDQDKRFWSDCTRFIDDLKATVPSRDRSYDKNTNEWTIDESYAEAFQALRKKYFEAEGQQELWDEF